MILIDTNFVSKHINKEWFFGIVDGEKKGLCPDKIPHYLKKGRISGLYW